MLRSRLVCLRLDHLFFLFSGFCRWRCLLWRRYFLFHFRSGERLAIKRNLGDGHRSEWQTMSPQALILLLTLVMENQNFLVTALFHHLANHSGFRLRPGNLAFAAGNRQYVAELDVTVHSRDRL